MFRLLYIMASFPNCSDVFMFNMTSQQSSGLPEIYWGMFFIEFSCKNKTLSTVGDLISIVGHFDWPQWAVMGSYHGCYVESEV